MYNKDHKEIRKGFYLYSRLAASVPDPGGSYAPPIHI